MKGRVLAALRQHGEAVLLAAAGLALYAGRLDRVPDGFHADEVSIAWNARHLLAWGRDEHGQAFPLFFKAFGDYKNPITVYLSALLFAMLGPAPEHVRLVGALAGVGDLLWVRALGMLLAGRLAGGVAGAVLLVLPWHLELSRIGFEVSCSLFFLLGGLYLLLRWAQGGGPRWAAAGAGMLGAYLYAYSAARLLAPLALGLFALTHARVLKERRRDAGLLFAVFTLAAVPLAAYWGGHPQFTERASMLGVWREAAPLQRFLTNYGQHFFPSFLFLRGDTTLRHHAYLGRLGELYLSLLPLLLAGAAWLWRRRREPAAALVLALLAVHPVASALTVEAVPHALRAYPGAALFALVAGLGAAWLRARRAPVAPVLLGLAALGSTLEGARFLQHYFVAYPSQSAYSRHGWQKEEAELYAWLRAHGRAFDHILETTDDREQPQVFRAFYLPEDIRVRIQDLPGPQVTMPPGRVALLVRPWQAAGQPWARGLPLAVFPRSGPPLFHLYTWP